MDGTSSLLETWPTQWCNVCAMFPLDVRTARLFPFLSVCVAGAICTALLSRRCHDSTAHSHALHSALSPTSVRFTDHQLRICGCDATPLHSPDGQCSNPDCHTHHTCPFGGSIHTCHLWVPVLDRVLPVSATTVMRFSLLPRQRALLRHSLSHVSRDLGLLRVCRGKPGDGGERGGRLPSSSSVSAGCQLLRTWPVFAVNRCSANLSVIPGIHSLKIDTATTGVRRPLVGPVLRPPLLGSDDPGATRDTISSEVSMPDSGPVPARVLSLILVLLLRFILTL